MWRDNREGEGGKSKMKKRRMRRKEKIERKSLSK